MLERLLLAIVVLFPISEIALAFVRRSRAATAQSEDRGSMRVLWLGIALGMTLAIAAQSVRSAVLPIQLSLIRLAALILLVTGLALRCAAILTLGKLFTVDVAIRADHTLVDHGLYRFVRHPSYSGLLIAFVGLGLFFDNWLSLIALLLPVTLAIINRVRKEERALLAHLGAAYAEYCARTNRFIPGRGSM